MEYVLINGTREPIPDAVVSASDNRDLVAEYLAASPADREHIHQMALEAVTPKTADAPAPTAAPIAPAASESTAVPSAAPTAPHEGEE